MLVEARTAISRGPGAGETDRTFSRSWACPTRGSGYRSLMGGHPGIVPRVAEEVS